MKKLLAFILSAVIGCCGMTALAAEEGEYNLNLNADEISLMSFSVGGGNGYPGKITEKYLMWHFDYRTIKRNEIEYITHMLNSLKPVYDGQTWYGADGISYSIRIGYSEGGNEHLSFGYGRMTRDSIQYALDENDIGGIFEAIYGLKMGKTILPENIDFAPSDWAEDEIDEAIDAGFVPETSRVNYTAAINRLEMCHLLDGMLQPAQLTVEDKRNSFDDISDNAVLRLRREEIINGKSETEFCPFEMLTREEFATILSRTMKTLELNRDTAPYSYVDADDISDWAAEDVNIVTNAGLMQGKDNGAFKPQDTLTKEEMIVTLLRLSQI